MDCNIYGGSNMNKLKTKMLFSVIFLVFVFNSRPVASQEVEDESEFNYVEGSTKGPERWGEIHPDWAKCNNGDMQSPIDLSSERVEVVSNLGKFERDYRPSNATVENRGHDIMLKWVGVARSIQINDTQYVLQQCHWHSPSEHTINGRRFDLEAHMVHESSDKKVAVFGIMYKIGRADTFLTEMMGHIASIADKKSKERAVGMVNPKHLKRGSRKYYRYIGSLTIPPCTQHVVWTMLRKVRTVSREQVGLIRAAVHDDSKTNARPLQPINKRSVRLYRPRDP